MRQSRISAKTIASRSSCLVVNPYQVLGQVIYKARTSNNITQETLGEAINITRQSVSEIEAGNRKLDLFEVKDIVDFFSAYSLSMLTLKKVFDDYFPKGNHGTQSIHQETGRLVYDARRVVKITRRKLARQTGIDESLLWRIESGYSRIYLLEAWAIAHCLRDYSDRFLVLDSALLSLLLATDLVLEACAV